jgi:magnesium-transporting ATPase (P-type)
MNHLPKIPRPTSPTKAAAQSIRFSPTLAEVAPLEFANICFLGTGVESGAATAVVLATGPDTYFGRMAEGMTGKPVQTAFDKGVQGFTWLMIRFMMVMVPLVFFINGFTKHNWREAFFFSIAVAVGLTPETLPIIVSVCLSRGAPEAVFPCCTFYELDGDIRPLEPASASELIKHHEGLSADGFRVLAVAHKRLGSRAARISKADGRDLILRGYIGFLDPPKESAGKAIGALRQHGVTVKVLTGDNGLVTRKVCREVGLDAEEMLVGSKVEAMTDDELAEAAERTHIFVRLSPADKQRIIRALQHKGHVVGFMGDGINDAPALHVADGGISVDSASRPSS